MPENKYLIRLHAPTLLIGNEYYNIRLNRENNVQSWIDSAKIHFWAHISSPDLGKTIVQWCIGMFAIRLASTKQNIAKLYRKLFSRKWRETTICDQ